MIGELLNFGIQKVHQILVLEEGMRGPGGSDEAVHR
jgi:hypothetical protein